MARNIFVFLILAEALTLSACSNTSTISFDSIVKTFKKPGPAVQINLGGRALIVESGKTPQTGVHGWATISAMGAPTLKGANGSQIFLDSRGGPKR